MKLYAYYCIHCHRHFIGKGNVQAAKRHMREAHNRRGTSANIRINALEIRQDKFDIDRFYLVDFDGIIEVCYTPVAYVNEDESDTAFTEE
jgi:hypothetical protein